MTESRFTQQQRELPEPAEGSRPVPKLVLTIIFGLLVWAAYYLYAAYNPMPAALGDNRVAADFAASTQVDGAQLYTANCVACHQANGKGLPGVFPPLAGSEWVVADKPDALIAIVLHGIQGPLTVAGAQYNGLMPHFHDKFSNEEIAGLVNHLRSNFGNTASATDAEYVAAIRHASETRSTPYNGDEDLRPMLD